MKQVLFLGAEGSGKSLLIRRIREVKEQTELSAESTVPTTGTEMKTLEIMPSCEVTLREVGASMASRWESFAKDAVMIVFVIDSADVGRLASAHALLLEVLMFPSLLSKPVLLAYNKTDIADVGSVSLIDSVLRVHELLQGCPKVKRKVIGSCLDESLALDTLSFIEMELN